MTINDNHMLSTKELARKTAVLNSINEIFSEALRCETDEELGKTCLAVAERLTNSKFGQLGELNDNNLFNTLAISNPGWDACKLTHEQAIRTLSSLPLTGVDRGAMLEGCSRIVNGKEAIENHPEHVKMPEGHPPMSAFLGVPFVDQGKVIGMIGLGNKPGGYTLEDQENIEALSIAIIEAYKSKRFGIKLQHSLENLLITEKIAGMGSWEWDLQADRISLSENCLEHFRIKSELFDGKFETLLLRIHPDDREEVRRKTEEMISSKVPQDFECRILKPDGSQRIFKSISKMDFDDHGNVRRFMGVFQDITEQKRAEERVSQAKEFSDTLNMINDEISSTLDFDQIMESVVKEASKAIGCDKGAIHLREGDFWITRHVYGFPPELIGSRFTDEQAPFSALASKTREPIVSVKAQHENLSCQLMRDYQIKSLLVVPLFLRSSTLGCALFAYDSAATKFSPEAIDFAEKLAVSVSLAAENARLYAKEHKIAEALQQAHLKLPEEIDGIDFGHIYRSATTEEAEVGGDFYDLFELDDDHIAINLGDVSGKGLEAAELTSIAKTSIRGFAYQGLSPAEILDNANLVINKTTPTHAFITVFFGILEKSSGLLKYCNAGHWPGLIKKKFDVLTLNGGNPALGISEDLKYQEDEVTIAEDDDLIIYTDGVVEARGDSGFYSEERLVKTVKELESANSKKIAKTLFDDVDSFSNHIFSDDLAILTVSLASTKIIT